MTFVVGVLRAIAWPATLLLLVFALRRQIRDLIPLLRKLKVKEFELEFAHEIAQINVGARAGTVAEASGAIPSTETSTTPLKSSFDGDVIKVDEIGLSADASDREKVVRRLAQISPRAAILEAWVEVEAAASTAAASFWLPGNHPEVFRTMNRLGEYLLQCKVIDAGQLVAFNKLRELRNKAAHAEELNLGVGDADKYVDLAFALADHIRTAAK
ncbi:hypothetical protein [Rhodanobacter sp. DHG33]|uniref:hypothetical protein n=1 Tax=Rhodanobacter sp. DHG33 TaxID=2775921 RepID=UPI001CE0C491|nr:hypothetical protein [Rhodanobacter sp. DHG33]